MVHDLDLRLVASGTIAGPFLQLGLMGLTEIEAPAATEASGTTSKSFASKAKSTESKEWANELVRDSFTMMASAGMY